MVNLLTIHPLLKTKVSIINTLFIMTIIINVTFWQNPQVKHNTSKFSFSSCLYVFYFSIFRSILEYGVVIWHPYLIHDQVYIQRIFTLCCLHTKNLRNIIRMTTSLFVPFLILLLPIILRVISLISFLFLTIL